MSDAKVRDPYTGEWRAPNKDNAAEAYAAEAHPAIIAGEPLPGDRTEEEIAAADQGVPTPTVTGDTPTPATATTKPPKKNGE